jgi:RHS repeat-associated protein
LKSEFMAMALKNDPSTPLRAGGSIVGWGCNDSGQATPPAGSDYVAIAAGAYHALALKQNGSIVGWGNNDYGQAQSQDPPMQVKIVERYTYDVYGKPTIKDANGVVLTKSAFGNRFMFTGREYDWETGNYYYRARYYSPKLGRFLQTDPIGYSEGLNLYTYCRNNPVMWVDPFGLNTNSWMHTTTTTSGSTTTTIYYGPSTTNTIPAQRPPAYTGNHGDLTTELIGEGTGLWLEYLIGPIIEIGGTEFTFPFTLFTNGTLMGPFRDIRTDPNKFPYDPIENPYGNQNVQSGQFYPPFNPNGDPNKIKKT